MLEAQPDHAPAATVLVENSGRFFCYEPGLALIASDDSAEGAYHKFVAARRDFFTARRDFFEQIALLGLEAGTPSSKVETAASLPPPARRGVVADLGLFLAKTCIILLIIAAIGSVLAMRVTQSVDRLAANVSSFIANDLKALKQMSNISMADVVVKAEDVARDMQSVPEERKDSLRRSVGILYRELTPIIEAWRMPPASESKTDPALPPLSTPPRQ